MAIGGMPERPGWKHEKPEPPGAIVCFSEDLNRADFLSFYEDQPGLFKKIQKLLVKTGT
jgi:hypothetical protein